MSSKRTRPRSIASQLVLLFTLAATLLLSCGLSVFYWIVVRHAFAEDNVVLADKISRIERSSQRERARNFRRGIEGPPGMLASALIGSGCSIRVAASLRKRLEWIG